LQLQREKRPTSGEDGSNAKLARRIARRSCTEQSKEASRVDQDEEKAKSLSVSAKTAEIRSNK